MGMNVVAHGKSYISCYVHMPQYIIKTKTTRTICYSYEGQIETEKVTGSRYEYCSTWYKSISCFVRMPQYIIRMKTTRETCYSYEGQIVTEKY